MNNRFKKKTLIAKVEKAIDRSLFSSHLTFVIFNPNTY